jgi:putative transposase
VLTDGRGMPIGLTIAGANVHDRRLVDETLNSIPVPRPRPTRRRKHHLCADKAYDADAVRREARRRRYTPHIRSRGEEQRQCRNGHRPRRWVVERIHSWMNRFRRILVRWEKKAANYIALLHLVFAHTLWRNS